MAITATTIKIPTPIPALNIPSIMEQLVNERDISNNISILVIFVSMVLYFKLLIINFQNYSLPYSICYIIFIDCYKIDFLNIAID